MKKGIKWIIGLVGILIVVNYVVFIGVYNFVGPYLNINNVEYRDGGYIVTNGECQEKVQVNGLSMYPTLQIVDFVMVDKCYNVKSLKIADIIRFEYGDKIYVHRVINIDFENEIIKTKGDNNIFADKKIQFDDYSGRIYWISSNRDFK